MDHRRTRFVELTLVLVLVVGLGFVAYYGWRTITFPFAVDYGEGPLLDQALRPADGVGIYARAGAEPPWTVSNYPPLFPLLESGLSMIFGAAYWYGRVVSLLCAAGAALFAGLIIRSLTVDRTAAWVTGLLLPITPYLCAPLAGCVWLLQTSRRRAMIFAGSLGFLVLIMGLMINALTAGGFWFNIVTANVNQFVWGLWAFYGRDVALHVPVLLGLAVAYVIMAVRTRPTSARVVVPYLIGAVLVSQTAAKIGSSFNYLLELSVALCLAAGALLGWLRARPALRLAVLILLAAQVLRLLVLPDPYLGLILGFIDDRASQDRVYQVVAGADGPVLADQDIALLPLAGKPILLQPFELSELSRAGRWDQSPLLASISEQRYAAILIYTIPDYEVERERWTDEMLAVLEGAYVVAERIPRSLGTTLVYRPRV